MLHTSLTHIRLEEEVVWVYVICLCWFDINGEMTKSVLVGKGVSQRARKEGEVKYVERWVIY